MPFNRQHFFGGKFAAFARERAKASVPLVSSGPARNLRHFGDGQPAPARSVKFRQTDKGDVRDIKVQPHTDGIGGHKIINLARLEHRHLRIAGARRQSAHDNRCAAAHPA